MANKTTTDKSMANEIIVHFDNLPDELLLMIYEWVPVCLPMLRKVNRRWRDLLADVCTYSDYYYANWAAAEGYKVYLDELSPQFILDCIQFDYINLILHGNYNWYCTDKQFLWKVQESCRKFRGIKPLTPNHGSILFKIMEALIIKYNIGQNTECVLASMVVLIDDVDLLRLVHKLGFTFNCTLDQAESVKIMQALHEFGCRSEAGILTWNIIYRHATNTWDQDEMRREMIGYAIDIGCEIRDEDFICAMMYGDKFAVKKMYCAGYDINRAKLLHNMPTEMIEYVQMLLSTTQ